MRADVTRVDVAALRAVAARFDTSAQVLGDAVRAGFAQLGFDGAAAGRDHVARGNGLRAGVDRLAVGLNQWACASREVAAALRATATRYAQAEARSSARLG